MDYEILLSILMGIGLSAAVGFRIFIPFLIVSIAAYTGNITLSEGFSWVGTLPALITFSVATFLEILAFYIPWIDNLLDTIASPLAAAAGAIIMASVVTELSPLIKWVLAIIAGGSIAASIQSFTGITRFTSSVSTGGIGNPVVATIEAGGSLLLSILSVIIPFVSAVIVLVIIIFTFKRIRRRRKQN